VNPLEAILVIQEHDTHLDQLRHRRTTLPERAAVVELDKTLATVDSQRAVVAEQLAAIDSRQEELERETAATVTRIGEIDTRMRSGSVAPRDLVSMQTEIDHLKERQASFEDQTLETMEEREPVDAELARLESERAAIEQEGASARAALAEAEAGIVADIASEETARTDAAAVASPDLLAEYERLRKRLGGIGAAPLVGANCGGCHLSLPATEVDRIKHLPLDAIVHCDQCGRILVRRS
jgi:hypothetical protein